MSDPGLYDRLTARVDDWVENALNPQAIADALTILLAEHEPAHIHAAALSRLNLPPGHCTYCDRYGVPLAVFASDFPGETEPVETHCHGYYDWCATCPSVDEGGGDLSYPCPPVKAVAAALGVASEVVT